ncbi:MAG: DNA-directed RNA polymerase subunit alpha C-terminal domain-containing protein [Candidatus Falkowbacteria bacterium]
MNDDRKYQSKKEAVLELLKMGMPTIVIQLGVGISPSTAHNYVARLRKESLWTEKAMTFDETIPKMLHIFSRLNFNRPLPEEIKFGIISRGELLACLSTVLDSHRVIDILEHSSQSLAKLRRFTFAPGIPEAYQNFLNSFNPNHLKPHMSGQALWNIYLRNILNGTEVNHDKKGLGAWQESVINEMTEYYMDIIRPNITPEFEFEIIERINKRLFPTLSERDVIFIKQYFGLDEKKMSAKEIAEDREITSSRVNQIYTRIVNRIKYEERLETILAFPLTWEKVTKLIDAKTPPTPVKPPEKPLIPGESLEYRLIDLDFSVRALNVFLAAELTALGDLTKISEYDLMRFRNVGLKTIKEIKAVLKKYGLSFSKNPAY